MRWTTAFALATSACDQRMQPWPVDRRMIGGKYFECVGLGEQSIAPLFQRVLARRILLPAVSPRIEAATNRFGVDIAHQLADVLKLALASAPRGNGSRLRNRLDQPFRQLDFRCQLG